MSTRTTPDSNLDLQQESAVDLSIEQEGTTERRATDRGSGRPIRERRHCLSYRQSLNNNNIGIVSRPNRQTMRERPAGKRPCRALTPQEKMDCIVRVHGGESKASVARDIGVPESTLRGWCKAEAKIQLQLNNMRASGNYEQILTTSSSENSDNSRPGSSRSTPTGQLQAIMGMPMTSAEKTGEEHESGPAQKRVKSENNSVATNINNISPSPRASVISTDFNQYQLQSYIYQMLQHATTTNDATTRNLLIQQLMKDAGCMSHLNAYLSPTNFIADNLQLHRNNGAVANLPVVRQQQQQTNNALLNGNKRKYSAPGGLTSTTTDTPKGSSRVPHSLSPNAEKLSSGSTSQQVNEQTSPVPSTSANNSDVVASIPYSRLPKNSKKLNAIICTLQQQQQHVSSARMCNVGEEMISSNAMSNNNNNIDHIDNETTNRSSNSLPPGFSEMLACCTKLVEWLQNYGSPICTFQQVIQIKTILDNMTNWANSKETVPKRKTNGTS
ncbi:PREDICTED: myb-like protein AA [Wasmannia auropunctata]|uniref:myb-like protein AA n=1 Tax=Wasmannia auropunctata TaxID=64793 RepID=UPI0005F059C2|nr:PREDICTED: myb-like protein AA [Wasmannia auropunctata]